MKRFFLLGALLVTALFALAGCGSQMTAQQIVDHMRDTAAKTDSAHLVVSISGQVNGQSAAATFGTDKIQDMKGDITLEIWYQKPNMLRAQVLASSQAGLAGAMLVHDGQHLWAYEPKSKIAYKLDTAGLRDLAGKANIPANLQDMLANPNLEDAINQVLSLTDYTLAGSEKVNGYDTYRLELQPKAGSGAATVLPDFKATVWVDQATWAPVKITANASQGNGALNMTTLDLNKNVPADTFQFTLPQGGHVVDLTGMTPKAVTIAEARQSAQASGYKLLEPSYVPAGATLVQVMASKGVMGAGATVVMNYSGGGSAPTFWISEMNGQGPLGKAAAPDSGGQAVTVRGVQGRLVTHSEQSGAATTTLWWKEQGTNLTIAIGGQIGQAELLKVAEGLK
jgi:outer membrane lipoprotein-sorting protein